MRAAYVSMLLFITCALFATPVMAATVVAAPNEPLIALQGVVADMYSYSLKIVGLCVFVMFLLAGLSYILPDAVRPSWMSKPNEMIKDAIIGLVLLFSAYLILNTINPDLVGGSAAPTTQARPLTK